MIGIEVVGYMRRKFALNRVMCTTLDFVTKNRETCPACTLRIEQRHAYRHVPNFHQSQLGVLRVVRSNMQGYDIAQL